LSSDQYSLDEAYWKLRFADLPQAMVRTPTQLSEKLRSGRSAQVDCGLTEEESAALRRFAREHGSSAFKVILILAWSCFTRLYQIADLTFAVPLAGRTDAPSRSIVGLFAKVMPVRVRLDPAMPLRTGMAALDNHFSEDLKHQHFPAYHINRLLQLRRRNHPSLYDVGLNYVRSNYAFDMGGSPVACSTISTGFSLPWTVSASEFSANGAIRLLIKYDQGRVQPEAADRLARCLRKLLSTVSEFVDLPIDELATGLDPLPATSADEPRQIAGQMHAGPNLGSAREATSRAARDEVETQLLEIWRRHLGVPNVGIDDDYFNVGGDSLKAVLLLGECNEQLGTKLALSVLFESRTVAGMAEAIRGIVLSAPSSRLVCMRAGDGGQPLLLIHPVGGSVFCYADLVAGLESHSPIYGLQAAGLQGEEHLPESVEEMAEDYLRMAANVIGTSSVHLAGWSFGGLIAVDMARQLALMGRPAVSVTLIDTAAYRTFSGDEDKSAVLRMAAGALGIGPERSGDGLTVPQQQFEQMTRLIRNARQLRQRYRRERIPVSLTLVRAALEPGARDEDFDWSDIVEGDISTVALPATHDSIIRSPHVAAVASILAEKMNSSKSLRL